MTSTGGSDSELNKEAEFEAHEMMIFSYTLGNAWNARCIILVREHIEME